MVKVLLSVLATHQLGDTWVVSTLGYFGKCSIMETIPLELGRWEFTADELKKKKKTKTFW